jgi:hypothetical protein
MTPALLSSLLELYRRLAAHDPDPDTAERLRECLEDNGLVDDERAPGWLVDALHAALAGTPGEPVFFEELDGDVANFLSEASDLVPGWRHDDQGETVTMAFPALGMEIYVSREALSADRRRGCKYTVRRTA